MIQQLQMERASVKSTILELESVHIDPMLQETPGSSAESQKLDLENAVLMQELMAIKVTLVASGCDWSVPTVFDSELCTRVVTL